IYHNNRYWHVCQLFLLCFFIYKSPLLLTFIERYFGCLSYLTFYKYNPSEGMFFPAYRRSCLSKISAISFGFLLPVPVSNNAPTMIRTMCCKKPLPRSTNSMMSPCLLQLTSDKVRTLLPFAVDFAEAKVVKSCVPSNTRQACCIFSKSYLAGE